MFLLQQGCSCCSMEVWGWQLQTSTSAQISLGFVVIGAQNYVFCFFCFFASAGAYPAHSLFDVFCGRHVKCIDRFDDLMCTDKEPNHLWRKLSVTPTWWWGLHHRVKQLQTDFMILYFIRYATKGFYASISTLSTTTKIGWAFDVCQSILKHPTVGLIFVPATPKRFVLGTKNASKAAQSPS